ncbi:MAG: aminodeoxychorismate lyase, partial [Eggerthellaceae bacterium]|nr:aminodeoxychorismate lyase [Eggerthellaceae bacterium]
MFRRKVTYSRKPTHAARAAHARGERQFSKYDTSLIEPRRSKKPFYIGIAAVVFAIIVIFGLVNCMGSCDKNPNMLPSDQQARIEIPD